MHLILVLVGAVLAFAGALLVLYAVPVIDAAAAALFSSGIFAIVGALILMALAAVLHSVSRIADRLDVPTLSLPAVPPIASMAREEAAARPAHVEAAPPPPKVPAAAPVPPPPAESSFQKTSLRTASAKKPSVLSALLARASQPAGEKPAGPSPEPDTLEPDLTPLTRVPDEPRGSVPFGAPSIERALPPSPPAAAQPPPQPPPLPPAAAAPPAPPPPIPRAVTPQPRLAPRTSAVASAPEATVYKSGVIDGMAYTLYMDGAIEAELPQGRVRFASVDELQKYLTSQS